MIGTSAERDTLQCHRLTAYATKEGSDQNPWLFKIVQTLVIEVYHKCGLMSSNFHAFPEAFNSLENSPIIKLLSDDAYLRIRVICVIRDSDNSTIEYL